MVQLAQPVDATQGQTMDDRTPLPAGDYKVMMTESEEKNTKAGDGWYIALVFVVLEGEFSGRTLRAILNLGNKNATAVESGYKELNTIGQATGQLNIQNTDQFLNIPIIAEVGQRGKAEDQYGIQNEIKNYSAISQAPAPIPAPIPQQQAIPQQAPAPIPAPIPQQQAIPQQVEHIPAPIPQQQVVQQTIPQRVAPVQPAPVAAPAPAPAPAPW